MENDKADDDTFPEMVPPPPAPVEEEEVEDISEYIPDEEQQEEEYEENIIHPEPKELLKKTDMFISTPSSKKNIKLELDEMPEIAPVKKPRKKRVMTEEAKAKFAIARAKGMEVRKKNAELRKQAKLEAKLENKNEDELVKKVKAKRVEKLKKELDDEDVPKEKKVEFVEKIIEKGYTQDDMTKAISTALLEQEKTRKLRKVEKNKLKEEKAHQQKIFNTISKAVQPSVWDDCFS